MVETPEPQERPRSAGLTDLSAPSPEDDRREFARTLSGFSAVDKPAYEDYSRCIHCGLCLNHCPTYRLWGREADSPRGRIQQMALVDAGRLEVGDSFVLHMDRCLDCRACETACPSAVEYGKLIELARAQIQQKYKRPAFSRLASHLVYRGLVPYPRRIALVARAARIYQKSGFEMLARKSGLLKLVGMQDRARLMPRIDTNFFFGELGQTFPPRGPRRGRVAFFAGCLAQVTFSELNRATIRVLQANGCEVVVPAGQNCCGALPAHAGVRDVARQLAQENMEAFPAAEFDAIVSNAAGCGSMLKEYPHLFTQADQATKDRARSFAGKVRDVTEFLAELGLTAPLRPTALKVTYQDSCHLAHGQKIREAPRTLIRAVPGVELIEMPMAEQCCGSAGVYNITQTKTALELLAEKMQFAKQTRAAAIVTANPGCILQLRAGAAIHGTGQEVLHVVELLDRALETR